MNSPGSICSAWPAVCEYPGGLTFEDGLRIGVADPLQVMQAVQAEVGLGLKPRFGTTPGMT
jgi:hypothetical protein